ncbi:MAG: T9SS type A sorting domain-containing protein [Bacteroidia bacterium]
MRYIITLLAVCLGSLTLAQDVETSEPFKVEKMGRVVLSETAPGASPWFRNTWKAPEPGTATDKQELKAIQKRIFEEKKQAIADGSYFETSSNNSRATAPSPQLVRTFQAELSEGFPNDNESATAPNGFLVSTTNTGIKIFDANGTRRLSRGLNVFSNSISTRSTFKYDPRAFYDQDKGRFIIVYLSGARPTNSEIIVCFSETDNPLGAWNIYAVRANLQPNGTEVWSDYPNIGISNSDLFITTNMFDGTPETDFIASGLFHIGLSEGYAGTALNVQTSIFQNTVISILPVTDVSDIPNDNFWLIAKANRQGGNNFVFYEVNGPLGSGGSLQAGKTIRASDAYSFAPPTPQRNSSVMLQPGDSRLQAGYRRDNKLYFVMNTGLRNRAAIYYGELEISPLGALFSKLTTEVITTDSIEFAFPSICWAGSSSGKENASYIFFNYSGTDHLPGTGVIYMTEQGTYSPPLLCTESDIAAPAPRDPADPRRWGDYATISHQGGGVAWGLGYDYPNNGREATVASLIVAPTATSVATPIEASPVTISPNPARERVNFTFEVPATQVYRAEVLDMQGRVVELLVEDRLTRGEAKLSFATDHLPAGIYVVRVAGDAGSLLKGKFVVVK